MFKLKSTLTKQEKLQIAIQIKETPDIFSEFYITQQRLRLSIKSNLDVLFKKLKFGDKVIFGENDAIGVITGFADKQVEITDINTNISKMVPTRKYLVLLAKTPQGANRLLTYLNFVIDTLFSGPIEVNDCIGKKKTINISELFCKLKISDPILKMFYAQGWVCSGLRGNEVLLTKIIYEPTKILKYDPRDKNDKQIND